ncbi:hypothetical protein ID866_8890 [Astraeus odoratus]|nr:hypothetical protein ID866_8890 [Astraeus odoratus]
MANGNDDDEIVILSSWKTKQQGGSEMLKEITDQQWGKLIQVVSTCMDVANGHLEQIASAAQSNGYKVQWHHLLMEGLVGQQQEPKELQETQGEGLGAQEETEGVPVSYPCQTPVFIPPQTQIFCLSHYLTSTSSIPPLVLACLYLVYLVFLCCANLCTPLPYICYISCLPVILTSHLHFLITQYFTHLGLPLIL